MKLYAFIADGEGLVASGMQAPQGTVWATFVTLDNPRNLAKMRAMAENIAQQSGRTIRLYEFTDPKEIEVFTGVKQ